MALHRLCAHCDGRFVCPDLPTRNALLEAVRAATHHPDSVHGASLCPRVVPVVPLLQPQRLFRGSPRLLRGLRHCLLLQSDVRLHGARPPQPEALLPQHLAETVAMASNVVPEMLWR